MRIKCQNTNKYENLIYTNINFDNIQITMKRKDLNKQLKHNKYAKRITCKIFDG